MSNAVVPGFLATNAGRYRHWQSVNQILAKDGILREDHLGIIAVAPRSRKRNGWSVAHYLNEKDPREGAREVCFIPGKVNDVADHLVDFFLLTACREIAAKHIGTIPHSSYNPNSHY